MGFVCLSMWTWLGFVGVENFGVWWVINYFLTKLNTQAFMGNFLDLLPYYWGLDWERWFV